MLYITVSIFSLVTVALCQITFIIFGMPKCLHTFAVNSFLLSSLDAVLHTLWMRSIRLYRDELLHRLSTTTT